MDAPPKAQRVLTVLVRPQRGRIRACALSATGHDAGGRSGRLWPGIFLPIRRSASAMRELRDLCKGPYPVGPRCAGAGSELLGQLAVGTRRGVAWFPEHLGGIVAAPGCGIGGRRPRICTQQIRRISSEWRLSLWSPNLCGNRAERPPAQHGQSGRRMADEGYLLPLRARAVALDSGWSVPADVPAGEQAGSQGTGAVSEL
jgi:hypothetical protein